MSFPEREPPGGPESPEDTLAFDLLRPFQWLVMLGDPDAKWQFDQALDEQEFGRWVKAQEAVEKVKLAASAGDQDAAQKLAQFEATKDPSLIDESLGDKPLVPFTNELINQLLWLTMEKGVDLSFSEVGGGHEFVEISKILQEDDVDTEGSDQKDFLSFFRRLSPHRRDNPVAADIAALDYIRCTKLTAEVKQGETKAKIKKREKLDKLPIEFKYQAEAPQTLAGGSDVPGNFDLSSLLGRLLGIGNLKNLFGGFGNVDQLLKGIFGKSILGDLSNLLGINLPDVVVDEKGALGNTIDPGALLHDVALGVFRDDLGSLDPNKVLSPGGSLGGTLQQTGLNLLSQALPGIPDRVLSRLPASPEALAEELARDHLGSRLVGPGFRWDGQTAREALVNLGEQYLASLVGLAPTTDLRSLPRGSDLDVRRAIGRVALSQRLALPLEKVKGDLRANLGDQFSAIFGTNPEAVDALFLLTSGTTQRLAEQGISSDQYAELIGQALTDATIGAYSSSPLVRAHAFGIGFILTESDLFLPTRSTTIEELAELEKLYRFFIPQAEWQFFADHYKNPAFLDLDEESEIRTYLASHMTNQPDFIGDFQKGSLTDDHWLALGKILVAKAGANDPFGQLAIFRDLLGQPISLPLDGTTQTIGVADFSGLDERLGLLPGEFRDGLLADEFELTMLPRLGIDLLAEAVGQAPEGNSFLLGGIRRPFRTDEFLSAEIDQLKNELKKISVKRAGQGALNDAKTAAEVLNPTNWKDRPDVRRDSQIDRDLRLVAQKLRQLKPHLEETTFQNLAGHLTNLISGRILPDPRSLVIGEIGQMPTIGLTTDLVNQILAGQTTAAAAATDLGAKYISQNLLRSNDPDRLAEQLTSLATNSGAINQFIASQKSIFDQTANNIPRALVDGTGLAQLIQGSIVPILANFGARTHQALTGGPGTIFGTANAVLEAGQSLQQIVNSAGLVLDQSVKGLEEQVKNLPIAVLESTGLIFADVKTPEEFLKANGAFFLTRIGAPAELVSLASSGNIGKILEQMKDPNFWTGRPEIQTAFNSMFGSAGGSVLGIFQDAFSQGKNFDPGQAIIQNIDQFFPGSPVKIGPLIQAAQRGDESSIVAALSPLAGPQAGTALQFFNFFSGGPKTTDQTLDFAFGQLPGLLGGGSSSQIIGFANLARQFFRDGQSPEQLGQSITGMAQALGIPFAGQAYQLISDPEGFGAGMAAGMLSNQLANLGIPIGANDLRLVLFGADPGTKLALANQVRNELLATPLGQELAGDRATLERFVDEKVGEKLKDLQQSVGQNLQFSMLDGVIGAPAGFAKTIFSGTGQQQVDALLGLATAKGNLPPAVTAAISIIKNGGDIGQLSGVAMGAFDNLLHLPGGTTSFITNGLNQLAQAQQAVGAAQDAILQNPGLIDGLSVDLSAAQAKLAGIQGALGGTIVSMVFGKQLAEIDKAFGGLPGVGGLLMNGLFKSLFSGQAFGATLAAGLPFLGFSLAAQFLGLGGLFGGGGSQDITFTVCSAGGFYPFVKKNDTGEASESETPTGGTAPKENTDRKNNPAEPEKQPGKPTEFGGSEESVVLDDKFFDPNPNLDDIDVEALQQGKLKSFSGKESKPRLTPQEVEDSLGLWPGYSGEFFGEDTQFGNPSACGGTTTPAQAAPSTGATSPTPNGGGVEGSSTGKEFEGLEDFIPGGAKPTPHPSSGANVTLGKWIPIPGAKAQTDEPAPAATIFVPGEPGPAATPFVPNKEERKTSLAETKQKLIETQKDQPLPTFACGRQKAARWKIRNLVGDLLLTRQVLEKTKPEDRLDKNMEPPRFLPNQLILYDIPDAQRGGNAADACRNDWDYTAFYGYTYDSIYASDSDEVNPTFCEEDDRFIAENHDGILAGILDWPWDPLDLKPWNEIAPHSPGQLGYGNGEPGSMVARHRAFPGFINVGMWVERSQDYRHHVHYGG